MTKSHPAFDVQLICTLANCLLEHRFWRCSWQHHIYRFLGHTSPPNSEQLNRMNASQRQDPELGCRLALRPEHLRDCLNGDGPQIAYVIAALSSGRIVSSSLCVLAAMARSVSRRMRSSREENIVKRWHITSGIAIQEILYECTIAIFLAPRKFFPTIGAIDQPTRFKY